MTFRHRVYASEMEIVRIVPKIARREFVEFWRELARPVMGNADSHPTLVRRSPVIAGFLARTSDHPCRTPRSRTPVCGYRSSPSAFRVRW